MPDRRHPGLILVGIFLCFGALMATIAGITLAFPGTALDTLWALNPRGYAGLKPLAPAVGYAFFSLAILLAVAAIGWFRGRYWGWWLAVLIIASQVIGDLINALRGDLSRGILGFVIAGALLAYLLSSSVQCQFFERRGMPVRKD